MGLVPSVTKLSDIWYHLVFYTNNNPSFLLSHFQIVICTIWWLDTLKRKEKIIRESAFDKKKKKPGLQFNSGLALTGVRTTGPWMFRW